MSQTEIRLDDLLARNIAIEWFEGVALIQAVSRVIRERGDDADGFPVPADVLLRPDGEVSVVRVAHDENGGAAAARLLADMARDTLPIQLRLTVSQATATGTGASRLAEFSKALAFFERPESRPILQQLYARAALASRKSEERAQAPERPAARDEVVAPRPRADRTRKRHGKAVAMAAAALLLVAAAGFVGVGRGKHHSLAAAAALQKVVLDQLGLKAAEPSAQPVEQLENGTSSAGNRARTAASGTRALAATRARSARLAGPRIQAPALQVLPVVNRDVLPELIELPTVDYAAGFAAREMFARPGAPATFDAESRAIYSATDPGVTPPLAIYPQLPTAPATVRSDQTVIELIVTPDGLVERARLRTVPRNVIEIMLLSAAKAWRFEPARAGGLPVRFLHRVVIAPEALARGSF